MKKLSRGNWLLRKNNSLSRLSERYQLCRVLVNDVPSKKIEAEFWFPAGVNAQREPVYLSEARTVHFASLFDWHNYGDQFWRVEAAYLKENS